MFFSRRDVLRILSVSALIPSAIVAARPVVSQTTVPKRLPLEEFIKNQKLVDALRHGVQVMRSRPPSDPRSWFFQAAVHAVQPQLLADALLTDPKVAEVNQERFWSQCPHFGQNSANFVIWHRAYIYYFERILRDAAQEPELALPYWNYNDPDWQNINPNPRFFPEIFAGQFLPRSNVPNSLYHPNRELAFSGWAWPANSSQSVPPRFQLTDPAVSTTAAMSAKYFFGSTESEGFAGGITDDNPGSQGLVERSPHNQIHFAVGGVIGETAGAMADVPTAAFDPIFWVHHSNIDRLWAEWVCLPGKEWGTLPSLAWFEERPWSFYDFDISVKNETRHHWMDHRDLGIAYHNEDPNCQPLMLPQMVAARSAGVGSSQPTAKPFTCLNELFRADAGIEASALKAGSFTISGTASEFGARLRTTAQPELMKQGNQRIILELRGITFDRPPSAGFDVYVNLPEGQQPNRNLSNFVGTVALFGIGGHHGAEHEGSVQQFDITHLVGDPGKASPELKVQIVPFDLLAPVGGEPPLRRPDAIRIEQLRVIAAARE